MAFNKKSSALKRIWKLIKKVFFYVIYGKKPSEKVSYLRDSAENTYDAVDFIRKMELDKLNSAVEDRIRMQLAGERGLLRIGFLVNETAKWNCGPLLEELQEEKRLETKIILCLNNNLAKLNHTDRKEGYLKQRGYFIRLDEHLIDLYDWEKDIERPVEDIDIDILFYQQPWGMRDYPRRMAGRALNVYMHYGFMMMANHGMHYNIGTFHSYLWKYFTQTEEHRLLHLKHDPSAYDKLVVTGYPKLDIYMEDFPQPSCNIWKQIAKDGDEKRVIYAPHHGLGEDNLKMSTFKWMHKPMLRLAQCTKKMQWVYKPHPTLKYSVEKNKLMSRTEYLKYEDSWANLPNAAVYDSGDYFDIFKTSDVLITDCGSFLAEYLPTEKPIIWLISEDTVGLNSVGENLAGSFYKVKNIEEFNNIFNKLVMEDVDPLKDKRLEAKELLFPIKGKASTEIIRYIKSYFGID